MSDATSQRPPLSASDREPLSPEPSSPEPSSPEPSSPELMREQRLQRNLKIVVGGMGALIFIGAGAVVLRMAGFAGAPRTPIAATAVATPGGEIALELPAGAKVVSVSISGNRLAVHHESPSGTGIAVVDLDSGRRIADIKTRDAVPKN